MRELPPALIAKLNIGAGVVTPSESANPAEITRLKATRKKNTPHTTRGTVADFRPRPSRDRRAAPGGVRDACRAGESPPPKAVSTLTTMTTMGTQAVGVYVGNWTAEETIVLNAGSAQKLNSVERSAPRIAPHRLTTVKRRRVEPRTTAGDVPSSNHKA